MRIGMGNLVLIETQNQIATLTLNRAERHNSLTLEFLSDLKLALDSVRGQTELRSLVLQANGRSFSTGGDVQMFYDHRDALAEYASSIVGMLNQVIMAMVRLPVPIIAAVHGIVTGGSIGLVLASDVVLVAPEASFAPFYSVVGFSPDGGWTAMLPAVIGRLRASQVLMLNRTIGAEQSVQWGLANQVVAADRIRTEARGAAESIAQKKFGSIGRTKKLLWAEADSLTERLEDERRQFVEQIVTEQARTGMEQFLQRRMNKDRKDE
jgi:2-(1,2-epoxy-1,2-dihydrophenyl)acetyl-CoA isomerase